MGYENSAGISVSNQYGPRDTGGSVGVEHSSDSVHKLSFYLTADSLNDGFVPPVVVPKGAHFIGAWITVDEAFTGVTAITVGEKGAEATNGFPLVAADINAEGSRTPAGPATGTWLPASTTGVTADKFVGITKTGTATAGRGTLTLEFVSKLRDGK